MRDEQLEGWNREIKDPEFGAAGDYTEEIATPSAWAGPTALARIAKEAGLSAGQARDWMLDPDGYLQEEQDNGAHWYEEPRMAQAMDNAWTREQQERPAGAYHPLGDGMTDLTPYFAGILEALGRPVMKAHHAPPGGEDIGGDHFDGGEFAPGDATLDLGIVKRFIDNPEGEIQVMEIPSWIATAIGARVQQVVFSAESMKKNKREHPDLQVGEYALLPRLNGASRHAIVIQDQDHACVVIQEQGRRYLVAIKATQTGGAAFVTSFHRLDDPKELGRKLKRGRILPPP